jgi:hypothetical protein
MPRTRTKIAPPQAAGRKVLGALRRGLPWMQAAVGTLLQHSPQRSAPNRPDDGLRADRSNCPKLTPIRLPRQI